MFSKLIDLCRNKFRATCLLTSIIEAITLLFRFGLGLESTRHTASTIGKLTFGLRIHHGYIGIVLLLISLFSTVRQSRYGSLITVAGASLTVSDIIHHLILLLVTGSADFDMVYP
ncbi:MAG: hypothetical protein Kow0029_05410 [Candidatus Rifleibacteriota bacterium]